MCAAVRDLNMTDHGPGGGTRKPRICILANVPGWAFDNSAREIKRNLAHEFDITIRYAVDHPDLSSADYDLVQICSWGQDRYRLIDFDKKRVIVQVSSHRWQDNPHFGPCTPDEFARRYLANCETVICTSRRLTEIVANVFPRVFHTPNGVDATRFTPGRRAPRPRLTFGWAGKAVDEVKGFYDIVKPACGDRFSLFVATGDLPHHQMPEFYRQLDVMIVASRNEGEPLTLIEGMACGCYPVCVDVGIVPELIEHRRNGYIVPERTVNAFQDAFQWCEDHHHEVRAAGLANAKLVARNRSWNICAQSFARVYWDTLIRARQFGVNSG
jgi:glycosyltransferase involved in cell wall biosynthesis